MADLIDRKSVIDVIHKAIFDFFDIVDDDDESPMTYKDEQLLTLNKAIVTKIKALPSAERNGTWSENGGELKCSECHSIFFNDIMDMNKDEMPSFCPACGARMDGEHDE